MRASLSAHEIYIPRRMDTSEQARAGEISTQEVEEKKNPRLRKTKDCCVACRSFFLHEIKGEKHATSATRLSFVSLGFTSRGKLRGEKALHQNALREIFLVQGRKTFLLFFPYAFFLPRGRRESFSDASSFAFVTHSPEDDALFSLSLSLSSFSDDLF